MITNNTQTTQQQTELNQIQRWVHTSNLCYSNWEWDGEELIIYHTDCDPFFCSRIEETMESEGDTVYETYDRATLIECGAIK